MPHLHTRDQGPRWTTVSVRVVDDLEVSQN